MSASVQTARALERVARFLNMAAGDGLDAFRRRIVAVLHRPATEAVLTASAYVKRRAGAKYPNAPLIAGLEAIG